jgi:hypothetical protein
MVGEDGSDVQPVCGLVLDQRGGIGNAGVKPPLAENAEQHLACVRVVVVKPRSSSSACPTPEPAGVDGLESPAANTSWLRPLEDYTKALREAGFVITSLTEPHPSQQMIEADDWSNRIQSPTVHAAGRRAAVAVPGKPHSARSAESVSSLS